MTALVIGLAVLGIIVTASMLGSVIAQMARAYREDEAQYRIVPLRIGGRK